MSVIEEVTARAENRCELCLSPNNLLPYTVPDRDSEHADNLILICQTCSNLLEGNSTDINHWRCLNDTMWNSTAAVQVVIWRILESIKDEGWPGDLQEMLYLDEATLAWAKLTTENVTNENIIIHKDCHGVMLTAGDTVTLIQDLNVKGGGFTAKRGTSVKRISLVADNSEHIEGKVNGQQIVLLTKYVKKS